MSPSRSHREPHKSREERRPIHLAPEGAGPLFQRDYVIVVRDPRVTPDEAVRMIRADFPSFSPDEWAKFTRPASETGPLEVGHTMHVRMTGAGHFGVEVTDVEPHSLTLRTLKGHVEAGRISFGAHCDAGGRLVCRIRSRSRLSGVARYLGYELLGKHIQTLVWVTFLRRLAERCGGEPIGDVVQSWDRVSETYADVGALERPTFRAHPSGPRDVHPEHDLNPEEREELAAGGRSC
ncbi:MAG TPA: DUF1990 family protein [Armatimonadota bacterium]|nr:DUF1990 family protein [Armatimonadota bacterium]